MISSDRTLNCTSNTHGYQVYGEDTTSGQGQSGRCICGGVSHGIHNLFRCVDRVGFAGDWGGRNRGQRAGDGSHCGVLCAILNITHGFDILLRRYADGARFPSHNPSILTSLLTIAVFYCMGTSIDPGTLDPRSQTPHPKSGRHCLMLHLRLDRSEIIHHQTSDLQPQPHILNQVITVFYCMGASITLGWGLSHMLKRAFPPLSREFELPLWELTSISTLICVPIAVAVSISWFITRGEDYSFLLHDLLSFSIAMRAVCGVKLGTLR